MTLSSGRLDSKCARLHAGHTHTYSTVGYVVIESGSPFAPRSHAVLPLLDCICIRFESGHARQSCRWSKIYSCHWTISPDAECSLTIGTLESIRCQGSESSSSITCSVPLEMQPMRNRNRRCCKQASHTGRQHLFVCSVHSRSCTVGAQHIQISLQVWSEPSMVEAGAYEFADTAKFLAAGQTHVLSICLY